MTRHGPCVLDNIAGPHEPGLATKDRAQYYRPAALPGVEALHASFVTHRYTAHVHESWTIAAVDDGAATFELENSRHVAPAGTTFLIPPGAVHTGEPATPDGYRYRVLYLSQRDWGSAEASPHTFDRTSPVVVRHEALAEHLARLHRGLSAPGVSLEQGELLCSVSAVIATLHVQGERPKTPVRPRVVAEAVAYIHAHVVEDFTLHDLASAVQSSPYHLARVFHRHVGMPPAHYRRALRVLAAQRLLCSGERPADVALACGFYDQSHLNRHFKSIVGVTPTQYLRAS